MPEQYIANANADQLALLEELVIRKKVSGNEVTDAQSTQFGIAKAFSSDN